VVIELTRRHSGPAAAAAAALAKSRDPDAVVLALAADHDILHVEEVRTTCLAGLRAAEAGHIVTFGITPSAPKTSAVTSAAANRSALIRSMRLKHSWKSPMPKLTRVMSSMAIC
jgi:hypothetical protein